MKNKTAEAAGCGGIEALEKLKNSLCGISFTEHAESEKLVSFKAGGRIRLLAEVGSTEELTGILSAAHELKAEHMFIGNGSNVLFCGEEYPGLVITMKNEKFSDIEVCGEEDGKVLLKAGAGALLSAIARKAQKLDLTGFEFASGIPGSAGGAIFMNAGAYGGEMKDIVRYVKAVSGDGKTERTFENSELDFGYRHSIIQQNGYIVTEVIFALEHGNRDEIAAKMQELAEKRNSKQPLSYPSAGSFFKRPAGYFAGKLIEDAGLKGVSVGGAEISELHAGFMINKGGAEAKDIIGLMRLVQNTVYDREGVWLEPEVRLIGLDEEERI